MRLGVVVLNWNAAEDTRRCLLQVRRWRFSPGASPPVVWVVDNASHEPGLEAVRRAHPDVRFVMGSVNRGFGGGSNLGIAAALEDGCDGVVLLNNDATLDEGCVGSMVAQLSGDRRIGVVGPVLQDGTPGFSIGGRDIAHHLDSHIRSSVAPDGLLDVDYVPGTAALIGRRTFEAVGLLDEDFFFGGEMADLCARARGAGLRCVTDPRARGFHDLHRSAGQRDTLHVYYALRNRFLFVRKHHPRRRVRLSGLWTLRAGLAIAAALTRGRLERTRAIALGTVDGWRGQFGNRNDRVLG